MAAMPPITRITARIQRIVAIASSSQFGGDIYPGFGADKQRPHRSAIFTSPCPSLGELTESAASREDLRSGPESPGRSNQVGERQNPPGPSPEIRGIRRSL